MVRELRRGDSTTYICETCDLAYADRKWAEQCQKWDEAHPGSCNLEIVDHATPLPGG